MSPLLNLSLSLVPFHSLPPCLYVAHLMNSSAIIPESISHLIKNHTFPQDQPNQLPPPPSFLPRKCFLFFVTSFSHCLSNNKYIWGKTLPLSLSSSTSLFSLCCLSIIIRHTPTQVCIHDNGIMEADVAVVSTFTKSYHHYE